jgi:glycosyltransferase involved in cell wall biosynthesis
MTPQKGFHYLLRAMPSILIKFPRAILILVGAGSAERDLHRETEKLGIRGALRFAGERWDTRNLLAIADCYVQPSLYEGMSTAILEAMAAGVPVVASAVYGAVEAITDQVTGLLVPPAKPAALAKAVCRILEQGGIGPQLAKAGLEHVGLHYSFEVMVDSVEELLRFGISSV